MKTKAVPVTFLTLIFSLMLAAVPGMTQPLTGAPANPRLRAKAIATTLISAVLWGILYWITTSDIWSFR